MLKLYKYSPDLNIAKTINEGTYRFYELVKYIKMEDAHGRSDTSEGALNFEKEESKNFPHKLPTAKLIKPDGSSFSFSLISLKKDENYLKQYFIFCVSNSLSEQVMADSQYIVEISSQIFDIFETFFSSLTQIKMSDREKIFSHGAVDYYNIHNHPPNITNEMWREVFLKHEKFKYQDEYRAAVLIPDSYFNHLQKSEEKRLIKASNDKVEFKAEIILNSGIDSDGWRYIEINATALFKQLIQIHCNSV